MGDRCCGNCHYLDEFSWICCNGDSLHVAETVFPEGSCCEWESEDEEL